MAKPQLKIQQNEPDQSAIDAVTLSKIREAQDAHSSETGTLRSVFAKAEARGLHLAAAKRALRVVKSGKQDEMMEEFERTIAYLKLLGKPVKKEQIDMFDGETVSAPEDEKAGAEGLAAGRGGFQENQNPYEPGSPKGQSWLKEFRSGKAERDLVMSMPEPSTNDEDEAEED